MKKLFLQMFLSFIHYYSIAQGCSDAGFCSIGNLKPAENHSAKQKITALLTNGVGDENVYVFTPAVQYDLQLNHQWAIQGKITGNVATGNLGNAAGLGDIYLSGIFTPHTNGKWKHHILLSAKLPLNMGNIKSNNLSLPMQYQASLGTIDAITGYSISNEKWLFAAAWQQPLTGRNGNNFLPVYLNNPAASKYPPSNDFNRKADILLRVNYRFNPAGRLEFVTGLLGIYHTGNDTYIDGNVSNRPIEIKGSKGATVNITTAAWYKFSNKFSLGLIAGAPVAVRKVSPDGLTRSFIISPEIIFNF